MRDTLIMVAILGLVALGLAEFKKYEIPFPTLKSTAKAGRDQKKISNNNSGVKHEGTGHQHDFETQSAGSDEGFASNAEEGEKLPTIYSGQESDSQSSVNDSEPRKKAEKVVQGVPLESFVLSHKNSLGLSAVVEDTSPSMRVYVQCMEVKKKGLEYTGQEECQRLEGPKEQNLLVKFLARH